ncbi:MAG: TVP38/TMEM64 family protein [Desulforhabdus sp.]|jgi:uncharacterized membrane protein YdjX (TVP38/TMEM64 family)|nr:TVP38/TMEM64 family protein [Desulforhabdus sp.]
MQSSPPFDQKQSAGPDKLLVQDAPAKAGRSGALRLAGSIVLLTVLLGLAAAWQWTPLKEWLDLRLLTSMAVSLREHPMAPLIIIGIYVTGGLLSFPATILIVATAITFGPLTGFIYTLSGCVMSAVCTYAVGHVLGRAAVQRFAGKRLNQINQQLSDRGLLTVLVIRLAPVAPFSVVNMAAGASQIKFKDFTVGTIIGMAPGLFAITLFGDRLENAIRHPGPKSLALAAGLIALILSINFSFRKWLWKSKA